MFQDYFVRIKVKLNSDLDHYRFGLSCGLIGYTLGNPYKDDTYTAVIQVYFEEIDAIIPVVLDKLDIIDDEYLKFLKKRESQCLKSLKNATDIIKYVGPRGGFKKLSFTLGKERLVFTERTMALKIEKQLNQFQKTIKMETIS